MTHGNADGVDPATAAWTVIVHEEPDMFGGGFWAEIAEMPDGPAWDDGLDELHQDLEEAIDSHITALQQAGIPLPPLLLIPHSLFVEGAV